MHPTKREVHFLNEDTIIERVADAVQASLMGQDRSHVFEYQVRSVAYSSEWRGAEEVLQTLITGGVAESTNQDKGKGKERADDSRSSHSRENASPAGSSPDGKCKCVVLLRAMYWLIFLSSQIHTEEDTVAA